MKGSPFCAAVNASVTRRLLLTAICLLISTAVPLRGSFELRIVPPPGGVAFALQNTTVQVETSLDPATIEYVTFQTTGFHSSSPKQTSTTPPFQFTWKPYLPDDCTIYVQAKIKNSSDIYSESLNIRVDPAGAPWILSPPYPSFTWTAENVDLTITCGAVSRGQATYQWLFNGAALPDQTNATLSVTNFRADPNSGSYSFVAESFGGRAVSTPVRVAIPPPNDAPGGLILAANHTANIDAPIRLKRTGELLGSPFTVQVYAGPSIMEMEPVGSSGAVNGGYFGPGQIKIPRVAPGAPAFVQIYVWPGSMTFFYAQDHDYWGKSKIIQVTTGDTTAAELSGLEPIDVIYHDQYSVTVFPSPAFKNWQFGDNITLNPLVYFYHSGVRLTDGELTYQWLKNSIPIPGATSRILQIPNATFDDAAGYTMTVTDGIEVRYLDYTIPIEAPATAAFDGTNLTIRGGMPGRTFEIQSSEDLTSWKLEQSFTADPTTPFTFNLPTDVGPKKFYRTNFGP